MVEEEVIIENQKDLELFRDIEEKVLKTIQLGFDLKCLEILDNEEASSDQIELVKEKLNQELLVRLFGMANSVYYGKLRKGEVSTFLEVVLRLGTAYTKTFIIASSLFSLVPGKDGEILSARSFATSILARILGQRLGLKSAEVQKAELGGLFFDVGKIIIYIYQTHHSKKPLEERFTDAYHPLLGVEIIRKFELPEFLKEIISPHPFTLHDESFSISAVVDLAYALVDRSFKRNGNLIIQSPLPDKEGFLIHTLGSMISDEFNAIGLGRYIELIPSLSDRELRRQAKTEEK
jgi:putative nucleotidyltransferase with HDIG domain